MRTFTIFIIAFLFVATTIRAQESEIDRLMSSELKMTFPGIYFKHNSTDYAPMPYTVDSCFKFIALQFDKNLNDLVIWRDSLESEALTTKRIQKLKVGLKKHIKTGNIEIYAMGGEQKIARRTIHMTSDTGKINYLLTLNSVFEISKTHIAPQKKEQKKSRRRLVWTGWKTGFHWSTAN
ncbi:MAG TPA: hypothetical protein VGF30_04565 [Bacteroidia bacterium]